MPRQRAKWERFLDRLFIETTPEKALFFSCCAIALCVVLMALIVVPIACGGFDCS